MENIRDFIDFIKEQEKAVQEEHNKYEVAKSFDYFMKINGVDENTITEDMMDWYAYHVCDKTGFFVPENISCNYINTNDYVNEMLKTTSLDLLVKELNRSLPGTGKRNFVTNFTDRDDKVNTLVISKGVYDRDKIFQICDRMMWSFTSVEYEKDRWMNPNDVDEPYVFTDWGVDVVRIRVEPVKTKNITDFVKTNCGGKIYHLCFKDNVGDIMKCGLRTKGVKNVYRFINDRIFFFCGETKNDVVKNFNIVLKSKLKEDNSLSIDSFSIIEIDVNGYSIDFYRDGYYLEDVKYIGYTYNYFPPKRLRVVDINDFKSEK